MQAAASTFDMLLNGENGATLRETTRGDITTVQHDVTRLTGDALLERLIVLHELDWGGRPWHRFNVGGSLLFKVRVGCDAKDGSDVELVEVCGKRARKWSKDFRSSLHEFAPLFGQFLAQGLVDALRFEEVELLAAVTLTFEIAKVKKRQDFLTRSEVARAVKVALEGNRPEDFKELAKIFGSDEKEKVQAFSIIMSNNNKINYLVEMCEMRKKKKKTTKESTTKAKMVTSPTQSGPGNSTTQQPRPEKKSPTRKKPLNPTTSVDSGTSTIKDWLNTGQPDTSPLTSNNEALEAFTKLMKEAQDVSTSQIAQSDHQAMTSQMESEVTSFWDRLAFSVGGEQEANVAKLPRKQTARSISDQDNRPVQKTPQKWISPSLKKVSVGSIKRKISGDNAPNKKHKGQSEVSSGQAQDKLNEAKMQEFIAMATSQAIATQSHNWSKESHSSSSESFHLSSQLTSSDQGLGSEKTNLPSAQLTKPVYRAASKSPNINQEANQFFPPQDTSLSPFARNEKQQRQKLINAEEEKKRNKLFGSNSKPKKTLKSNKVSIIQSRPNVTNTRPQVQQDLSASTSSSSNRDELAEIQQAQQPWLEHLFAAVQDMTKNFYQKKA